MISQIFRHDLRICKWNHCYQTILNHCNTYSLLFITQPTRQWLGLKPSVIIGTLNKNVYNTYYNVPYLLRSDIFESEQILVSNSVFVENFSRFLEVFVPWIILYNSYRNNFFVIVFTCSIAFQRYQTWYGNNYLNLINYQAGPKKCEVLVSLHRATSRDVARRRMTLSNF